MTENHKPVKLNEIWATIGSCRTGRMAVVDARERVRAIDADEFAVWRQR